MTARTPTSAPGSRRGPAAHLRPGFTLIELLLVLLLIALVSGLASLSLRDGGQASLEREAQRLAALLEAGRAEARATGVAVRFELLGQGERPATPEADSQFRFIGLAPGSLPGSGNHPGRWLDPEVQARIENATALRLGPEPLIGAQRISLSLGSQTRVLATDGLAPFAVAAPVAVQP